MKRTQFLDYLRSLQNILNIPICYGRSDGTFQLFQPFQLDSGEIDYTFIFKRLRRVITTYSDQHVMFELNRSMIMIGIVTNADRGDYIVVGPVAATSTSTDDILDYLFQANLSADTSRILGNYLQDYHPLTAAAFQELLININLVLNDEVLTKKDLFPLPLKEPKEKKSYLKQVHHIESTTTDDKQNNLVYDYGNRMAKCIMTGDVDGLADLINKISTIPFTDGAPITNLHEFKLNTFGGIYSSSFMVETLGGTKADIDRLTNYYIHKIDTAQTVQEINKYSILSLYDFTQMAHDILNTKTDIPIIDAAMQYIKENIYNKLSAEDVASALHVSAHYLFVHFKEAVGKTLNQYITEEKIKKAQYYLEYTEHPLSEISNMLSFSSQSYFQTTFKKVTGVTPNQWRQKVTS